MSAEDIEYDDFKLFPTRESAIDWLRSYLSADETDNLLKALSAEPCDDYAIGVDNTGRFVKASEVFREPCDDTISRHAVLTYIERILTHGFGKKKSFEFIKKFVEKLPSVTPQPKMGRWLSFGPQGEIDGQIVRAFTCSECGAISIFRLSCGNIVNGDLCPNCGVKMEIEENG